RKFGHGRWPPSDAYRLGHACGRRAHVSVEVRAIAARFNEAGADGEITETLAFLPFGCISRKQWIECRDDAGVIEIFSIELVEARAVEGCAKIKVVTARPFANQSDLRQVRPRTTVWAARHANDNVIGGLAPRRDPLAGTRPPLKQRGVGS